VLTHVRTGFSGQRPICGSSRRSSIGGIVTLIRGAVLHGIVRVIIGLLIGRGAYASISRFRPEEEGPGGTRLELLPVRPEPM
jgi:hypothetical protein